MTHKEAFEAYIKSNRYQSDYHYIKQREGEKYAILFDYVAKIYIRYFLNGRGNKKRNFGKYISMNSTNNDVNKYIKFNITKDLGHSPGSKKVKLVFKTY